MTRVTFVIVPTGQLIEAEVPVVPRRGELVELIVAGNVAWKATLVSHFVKDQIVRVHLDYSDRPDDKRS